MNVCENGIYCNNEIIIIFSVYKNEKKKKVNK